MGRGALCWPIMIGIVGLGGARYFASNCTIAGPDGSSEQITKELKHLREYSSENNIVGVNKSVEFIVTKVLRVNPMCIILGAVFLLKKTVALDGISLDFF